MSKTTDDYPNVCAEMFKAELLKSIKDAEKKAQQDYNPADSYYHDSSTEMMEKEQKMPDGTVMTMIGLAVTSFAIPFGYTEKIKRELEWRGVKIHPYYIKRTNKTLIQVILATNTVILRVQWVPKKYFAGPGFWKIDKTELGLETIRIKEDKYKLWLHQQDLLKSRGLAIIRSDFQNDEKIKQLENLFNEKLL